MKYISTTVVFLGIWFIASLLNGLLNGACLTMFDDKTYGNETLGLSMLFSFIFSIPFVGAVWLVTTIAQLAGKSGVALFQLVLGTALFCAIAGAIFFISAFGSDFGNGKYAAGLAIIISAVSAVMIFRSPLKDN